MKLLVTLESLPALSPLSGLLKLGYKRKGAQEVQQKMYVA